MKVMQLDRPVTSGVGLLFRLSAWLILVLAATLVPLQAQAPQGETSQIRSLLEARNFTEAEAVLTRAIAASGETDELIALRAELLRRTDRLDQAYLDYKRLVERRPTDSDPHFWVATIDRWRDRNEEAILAYGNVLALSKCNQGALTGRARVHQSNSNVKAAEADLRTALECRPGEGEASELLAELLARRGDRTEAVEVLRKAFTGADLERRVGDMDMSRSDPAGARKSYQAALALRPDDPKILEKLADSERELGHTSTALSLYEKAASLSPDGGPLYWVGLLSYRMGRLDRAEAAFDEILKRKPNDSGALIGKARVRRAQSRTKEALDLTERALALRADNGEALVLRGALYESFGRWQEARRDYLAALTRSPNDGDAQLLFERIGSPRTLTLAARTSHSKAIEGLEDAGVLVNGIPIRPTRIEYVNDSAELSAGAELGPRTRLGITVGRGREAVLNNDFGRTIYDFDVTTAMAGIDRQLSDPWNLSWRVGATRFDPRTEGAILARTRARGNVALSYAMGPTDFVLGYSRRPYTHRGFAEDSKFRIFDEDRLTLAWERRLQPGLSLRFSSGASTYHDDGDSPINGALTLRLDRGGKGLFLRAGHDPFPARSLGANLTLDFIDFDGITAGAHSEFGSGFRVEAEGTLGRYGKTRRDQVINGIQVEGPLDENSERRARGELSWSPRRFEPLNLGVDYEFADFDFRTGPYNTRSFDDRSFFAEFSNDRGRRVRYMLRASHHWIDDDRAADTYDADRFAGNLKLRLGRADNPSSAYWLGLEGLYGENDLEESRYQARVFLSIPF